MIIQINYDLNKQGKNYDGLIEKIKSYGTWATPCKSYWLIATKQTPSQVYASLRPFIDANDSMVVSRFYSNDYIGQLSQRIIDWIENNQSQLRDISY